MSLWSLTNQQREFKRYYSKKHLWEFYPQNGGENQLAQIWNEITSLSLSSYVLKTHSREPILVLYLALKAHWKTTF